jgi:type IV pilus assembly protein PilN
MPRINLLPWREEQRKERKVAFGIALGAATAAALVATFGVNLFYNSLINGQEARNERLRSEIRELDKQIEKINDLEQQKQNFIARMQIIEKLQRSRPEIVHLFDELARTIPDGTYLTALKQTDARLKLDGVAQSSTRVSSFMRNIDGSQWLRQPELEVVESKPNQALGSNFTMFAEQVSLVEDSAAVEQPAGAAPKKGDPKKPGKTGDRTVAARGKGE